LTTTGNVAQLTATDRTAANKNMDTKMMICTICARGGSKGVKNKNTRMIAGQPLIAHSVQRALESGFFKYVAVSSDDPAILAAAKDAGANILVQRPDALATDSAAKIPAIQHCFLDVERQTGETFDHVIDLDATSPLRTIDDIKAVIEILHQTGVGNVITAAPARRSPYFTLLECDENGVPHLSKTAPVTVVRRQDAPPCYDMNAAVYGWTRASLLEGDSLFGPDTRLYVMPEDRSIDIDSELDFRIVEMLLTEDSGA